MSSDSEEELLLMLYLLTRKEKTKKKKKRKTKDCIMRKRFWVNEQLIQDWAERGEYNVVRELLTDEDKFFSRFRISVSDFQEILELVKEDIARMKTRCRRPVPEQERLGLTLSCLFEGTPFLNLSRAFSIGVATAPVIVASTCHAICEKLEPLFLSSRTATETLYESAEKFERDRHFPNCVGSLYGTHVLLRSPISTGYVNYAKKFSIVLLMLADSTNCLLTVDTLKPDRDTDDEVLEESQLAEKLLRSTVMPTPKLHTNLFLPSVVVGDASFPLTNYVMTPYPEEMAQVCPSKRTFNDRHSEAHKVAEDTLGLMAQRFKIFQKPIHAKADFCMLIVRTCCCLHNFFRLKEIERTGGSFDEMSVRDALEKSEAFMTLSPYGGEASATAQGVRENFEIYFTQNSRGVVKTEVY